MSAALRARALTRHEEGRPQDALALMREACRTEVDLDALNDLAVITAAAGDAPGARNVLDTVLAIDPSQPDARENREALGSDPFSPAALRAGSLGPVLSPKVLGYLLSRPTGDPELARRLDAFHSGALIGERWLYHNLCRLLWSGEHDVFENGPGLGGTTRAAALGMLVNPARRPDARLHTYDWFVECGEFPLAMLEQMAAAGLTSSAAIADVTDRSDFERLFVELHQAQDYSAILRHHRAWLPGTREELATTPHLFELSPSSRFDVVLVDGCKSWFGTRWFLEQIAPCMAKGTLIVMQDFGLYTCFWLSAITGLLRDRLRLVANHAWTYVFELTAPLQPNDLQVVPDSPQGLSGGQIDDLYDGLTQWSWDVDDSWLTLTFGLHRAAALAYIGYREEARRVIRGLQRRSEYRAARESFLAVRAGAYSVIKDALRAPTYLPGGESIRL
jgi:hypothetical protein